MKSVLIIDDEAGVTRFYRKLLESEKYEVLISNDAAEGTLSMVKSRNIDLILLDINMPEVDGAYMLEIIKEYNPQIKVIIFSVRTIKEQREYIPYANDYFDKSQSVEILLEKIAKLLKDDCVDSMR